MFSSAEEFLRSGTLASAACVITDVRMPGMDGSSCSVASGWSVRSCRSSLYPLIMTLEIRQKALDEGAVDFLYKPFDAADLLEVVQAALTDAR